MAPVVYRLLRPVAQLVARLFYRRIEVRGREHVPSRGPFILAANHPNAMMDPLLLITQQPRRLSFLAKATLFKSPLLGAFLSACGVLPVYRRKDSADEMGKNELTFEACFRRLEHGGAIAIFPEGITHAREAVMPLKTGCARIALEAESAHGFELGVRIVPAGIYFSNRPIFRSDTLVMFDPPLDPASFFDLYRRDPHGAVRELTTLLEDRLRTLTLHVPREEDEALLAVLRQIFEARSQELSGRLAIDRALVEAVEYFRSAEPTRYRELRAEIMSYGRLLALLGLTHSQVQRRYPMKPVLGYIARRLPAALGGLPVFLFGAVNHILPYKAPAWIARLLAKESVDVATIKLLAGLVSFPLFYGLQTALIGAWLGGAVAVGYLLLLPMTGLFALVYLEALSGFIGETRGFLFYLFKRDRLERLETRRQGLLSKLDRCREEYLTRAAGAPQ